MDEALPGDGIDPGDGDAVRSATRQEDLPY
jgi:hypothetical protein